MNREQLGEVFFMRDGQLWRKAFVGGNSGNRYYPKTPVINCVNEKDGYCSVNIKRLKKNVYYHRIVWILTNGDIPEGLQIDHINGNRVDNRLENLRLATPRQNGVNKYSHREGKLYGCSFHKNRRNPWGARAEVGGKTVCIGYFPTELEAHQAYKTYVAQMLP
jgi:hypothetical protein